jgi:hypothetical protein
MIQAFMRGDNSFYQKMIQQELSWQQQELQKEFEKIQIPTRVTQRGNQLNRRALKTKPRNLAVNQEVTHKTKTQMTTDGKDLAQYNQTIE